MFKNVEEARNYFKNDRYAAMSGIVIDALGDGWSECSMVITDTHRNAMGGVMGGAIFTLADLTFSVAANNAHMPTVAQQMSSSFLSMPKGIKLIARAKCRKDGRTTCVYNIDITDDTGRDIAQIIATGYKLSQK
ncbi:MAG: PaaI family thioesterase [Ruminococcus sp.]|nr:PaaI family thioesterase [Ruminococcus sp.]